MHGQQIVNIAKMDINNVQLFSAEVREMQFLLLRVELDRNYDLLI
jgi:hypothetical protein